MTQPALVPWPIESGGYPTTEDLRDYERAMKEAALQRLRLAVEALKHYESMVIVNHLPEFKAHSYAHDALQAIGDIP